MSSRPPPPPPPVGLPAVGLPAVGTIQQPPCPSLRSMITFRAPAGAMIAPLSKYRDILRAVRLRWLLRLYPAGWRDRYEREVSVVLDQHDCSAGTVLHLAAGARDAPSAPAPPASAPVRPA